MKRGVWIGAALALAGTPAFAQIDKSGGFGTGTGFQANGAASFAGGRAYLTPASANQAGSVFFTSPQDVRRFVTRFTFRFTPGSNPMAEGLCFVLQNAGATAIGSPGDGLGYAGIASSVAVKFDLSPGSGSFTGLYTIGAAPTTPDTALPAAIDFHSQHLFEAELAYDGVTLDVTITDSVSLATASQSYNIHLPSMVGGNSAFAGFTGSTGSSTAIQEVDTWTYLLPPAIPSHTLDVEQPGQVIVTWTASSGADGYNVFRSFNGGPFILLTSDPIAATSYVDQAPAGTYCYRVTAVGPGGESFGSGPNCALLLPVPTPHAPRAGYGCSAGSRAHGVPWPAAFMAALALASVGRRDSAKSPG